MSRVSARNQRKPEMDSEFLQAERDRKVDSEFGSTNTSRLSRFKFGQIVRLAQMLSYNSLLFPNVSQPKSM